MRLVANIPRANSSRLLLWVSLAMTMVSETLMGAKLIKDSNAMKVIQYIIILIPLGLNFLVLLVSTVKRRTKLLFMDELKTMSILILILGCLSLNRSVVAGKFAFNSIRELIQIILPFVLTFFVLNLLSFDEIASFMKFSLLCTIIGYLFSINLESITIDNMMRMLTESTYSPFENSAFAEVASGLGAYFIYNRKRMPFAALLAVFLNFLCWKRVFVLMAVILLVISFMDKARDNLKRMTVLVTSIGWAFIVFFTFHIYHRETADYIRATYNINLERFTGYRIYRLWYCYERGFQSYGLGSTSNYINNFGHFLGREFEMDFIRIMFEIGPIAIFAICYAYLKITRCNKYSYLLIVFCFLNLLMANGLLRYWGYTFRIITIAVINYYDEGKQLIIPSPYSSLQWHRCGSGLGRVAKNRRLQKRVGNPNPI